MLRVNEGDPLTSTAIVPLSPKDEARYLTNYVAARKALATCVRVDEVKHIRDRYKALQAAARVAKNTEVEDMAVEIRLRADRRLGVLMADMDARGELRRRGGQKGAKYVGGVVKGTRKASWGADLPIRSGQKAIVPDGVKPLPSRSELGLSKKDVERSKQLAGQSEKEFERTVAAAKDHTPKPRKKSAYKSSACDYDWSDPNPKDFADPSEMYGQQADQYFSQAIHLAKSLPLLAKGVDLKIVKSKINGAQEVADAWSRVVSELKARAKQE